MAKPSTISPEKLEELAYLYIEECLENKKEIHLGMHIHKVKDRHVPTIQFFLRIWIPKKGEPTIHRSTYYEWLNYTVLDSIIIDELPENEKKRALEHKAKSDTIKKIDEVFKALAIDIVANEGKAIFYAKNRLGMTDRQEISGNPEQPLFPPNINKK